MAFSKFDSSGDDKLDYRSVILKKIATNWTDFVFSDNNNNKNILFLESSVRQQ